MVFERSVVRGLVASVHSLSRGMCEARSHGLELDEDGQDVWVRLLCTWFGRRPAEAPRMDQGIVCMHYYSERRILVSGSISILLCGDCLVVGLSQQ